MTRWIVGAAAVVALLWTLGRLKLLYYFAAFGVGLDAVEPTLLDQLFESWFVMQNLAFAGLLWWIALKTRSIWVVAVAVVHALIPITSHYAFAVHEWVAAGFLIDYRHTLLKFVPFIVLAIVWFGRPSDRGGLRQLTPPMSPGGLVLAAIVLVSWGVSMAKHSGSFDAQQVMRRPGLHLSNVELSPSSELPTTSGELFLLHTSPSSVLLWDAGGFEFGRSTEVRTLIVPRSSVVWIAVRRVFQLQLGGQLL
jgi:hypothetical protein